MDEKQLHRARNVAIWTTAILGVIVGLAWVGHLIGLYDGEPAIEFLALLTAIGGISIGFLSSIKPQVAGDGGKEASRTRYRNFQMGLVFFVAFCGAMIGFVPAGSAQNFLTALTAIGGVAIGASYLYGRFGRAA